MRRTLAAGAAGFVLCWCALLAPHAAAQAGRGNAYGHNKRPSHPSPAAGPSAPVPSESGTGAGGALPEGTGIRNFGSWLDDASVMTPGQGFVSFAVGYWRLPVLTEFNAPSFDVGAGLSRRVQVTASVPVYHTSQPGAPVVRGVGNLLLSTKVQLRAPDSKRLGIAVVPVLEMLTSAPPPGVSRASWGFPVSFELQRPGWRAYGSAGYFTRGAVFGSAAIDVPVGSRAWITASCTEAHSIKTDPLSDALGLSSIRRDVSGGAAVVLSNGVVLFGNIGRTISRQDGSTTRLSLTAGAAMNFDAFRLTP